MKKLIELTAKEFAESLAILINNESDNNYTARTWLGYRGESRVYVKNSDKKEVGYVSFKLNGTVGKAFNANEQAYNAVSGKLDYLLTTYSLKIVSTINASKLAWLVNDNAEVNTICFNCQVNVANVSGMCSNCERT